jgi:hypothetical protein
MGKPHRALSDEERAERRRADRAFARRAVEQLRTSEGWQRWLMARRHFHSYSLANQSLIAMQKPEATRVAGFRAWLKLGYCVRKGETALRIWCPCPPSAKQLRDYFDVVVLGPQGENAARYLTKGRGVAIDGRLDWREYDGRDGTKRPAIEIIADTVQFLSGPDRASSGEAQPPAPARTTPTDDDIPF